VRCLAWICLVPGIFIASLTHAQLGGHPVDVPSLTPFSDGDRVSALGFARRRPLPIVGGDRVAFPVSPYTDSPDVWTPARARDVLVLTRWYLAHCGIELRWGRLRSLPPDLPKRSPALLRSNDPRETVVVLRSRETMPRGLGLATTLRDGRRRYVEVVWSPIMTTLAHELGHIGSLSHTPQRWNLMLNPRYVLSGAELLLSSVRGFFEPWRFGFAPAQCRRMRLELGADGGIAQ
jgi:hypothetical protein